MTGPFSFKNITDTFNCIYLTKGNESLPQTQIFFYLCNLMMQTFDISNLDNLILQNSWFEIDTTNDFELQRYRD